MVRVLVALLGAMPLLAGCVSAGRVYSDVPIEQEVARLKGLGFRTVASTGAGAEVLSYSGPITRAVECRRSSENFAPIPASRRTENGQVQTATLDAYLVLSPGADGVLSAQERTGIYIVTIRTRGGGGPTLAGIKFGPREQASFASRLTCRAA